MRKRPAETAARMAAAAAPLTLQAQERALLRPGLRRLMFRGLFHDPTALRPELIWEVFHNGAGRKGLLPAVQGLVGYDFLDKLTEVDVPTLIVWGRNDHVVPPSDAVGYGQRLRNSRTVIFDNCGHLPQAERPVRFNRVLETFLAE
jgi:2-hydroxy-6-oxonona-2,4-dienedioate hydrolase